ncbi:hypothetical protein KEM55_006790 [Ascosphaera atra]|nr:hypothetical protein KEM55_006790 [Ascosphaera atra]
MTYPIKSCRGVELPVANVVSTGMEFDRNFCFAEYIEESEGVKGEKRPAHWAARTMRDSKFRKMTLIRPEIWVSDPASPTYSPRGRNALSKGVMIVRYPRDIAEGTGFKGLMLFIAMKLGIARSEECFQVPLYPPPGHEYPSRKLRVWSDYPMAFDYGVHLPASLAKFVGATKPFTLLRVDPEYFRTVKRCAPTKDDLGFQVQIAFADVYPLNMQNVSSVRDVEKRVAHSIPKLTVRRYRPNIVLEGIPAYSEDDWKKIEVVPRKLAFNKREKDSANDDKRTLIHVVSRTPRCRLPNVDPDTGIRHPVEPDKTMRSFRCIDEGDPKKACLGMQLVPSVQEFELHVGDEIVVLEKGEHHYVN